MIPATTPIQKLAAAVAATLERKPDEAEEITKRFLSINVQCHQTARRRLIYRPQIWWDGEMELEDGRDTDSETEAFEQGQRMRDEIIEYVIDQLHDRHQHLFYAAGDV